MRPASIRVRLTAWYLAVILITLVVSTGAMYYGIQEAIEQTVDAQLKARSDLVSDFLTRQASSQGAGPPQLLPPAAGLAPADTLYQVTDDAGNMVFQSPGMRELEVPRDVNQLQHHYRHHRDQGNFTTYFRRHSDVRVLASRLQVGAECYQIQVASDVNPLYAVLETFRKWAWNLLPLIVSLSGIGGYWLTGRAMRPVSDLVHSTRDISERSLSRRIAVPRARDELRELAETINAMLARLESAFARVARFTSDASHELRTPVTVIRTTAEVILERERTRAELDEMVGLILRESESASSLIEQLLVLARSDADTERVDRTKLDLCDLLRDIALGSKPVAEAQGLEWSLEMPDQPTVVQGDRPKLRRLILILIENALRYTEANGSVSLRLTIKQHQALIEVKDTGIGIPPEELPRIFDRFYRASNARFFYPDGTGLGLPIAQWIASLHDGTLAVQSTFGSGTCMSVRLPLVKDNVD